MSCWSPSASYPSRGARRLTRDFSTLWRRQKTLGGNIPYRGSDGRFRQLPRTQYRNLTGGNPPFVPVGATLAGFVVRRKGLMLRGILDRASPADAKARISVILPPPPILVAKPP
ncbi:hypothetical protein EOW66_19395 [Sinirhodobacter huangdaonensis]|uniref:Uncharacterized protein n=1 Tax=Paenirhodobacter huangdaonensis TaxID=2501515 RepID=A0A3S3M5I8_9RHOB|nr:hypothetical protein EOW66_19395 [Sinirhodobacter huangdaonensis]